MLKCITCGKVLEATLVIIEHKNRVMKLVEIIKHKNRAMKLVEKHGIVELEVVNYQCQDCRSKESNQRNQ